MGLFGPSKKEKALQAEVERLSILMLPEHREIDFLNNDKVYRSYNCRHVWSCSRHSSRYVYRI